MNNKLPGIVILFLVATIGGYYLWQFGIYAASTFTADRPSFQADLKNTLDLQAGVGKPTFTRATTATVTDFEGLIKNVKSGEARFEGARRVENLFTYSEDFSNVAWAGSATKTPNYDIAPDGTMTANRIQISSAVDFRQVISTTLPNYGTSVVSLWVKATSADSTFRIRLYNSLNAQGYSPTITATSVWKRVSWVYTNTNGGRTLYFMIERDASSNPVDIEIWHPQLEDATGQSNQNPSEYVSTNVKTSAPYHGANVDRVKYFTTYNGNTVASNVVTEATGATIPDATLHGYVAEGARTNLVLQSETFDNGTWILNGLLAFGSGSVVNAIVAPSGATTAELLTENTSNSTHIIAASNYTGAAQTMSYSVYAKANVRTRLEIISSSDGLGIGFNLTTGTVIPGTYAAGQGTGTIVNVGNGWYRCTFTWAYTGVATSLRIVLHNGTSVTYTGDGTSGIYLWGAQLEAASFASSYIPTTTASVTRNADVLTYPTAGNVDTNIYTAHAQAKYNSSFGGHILSIRNVTTGGILLRIDASGKVGLYDGTSRLYGGVLTIGIINNVAIRFSPLGANGFSNGVAGTESVATSPLVNFNSKLAIGSDVTSTVSTPMFGTIRNVKIWKKALTDTQLTNMTSTNTAVSQSAVKKTTVGADGSSFQADLKNTLDLQAGVGKPTFTRATVATVTDFEGLIKNVKSGEARFEGARRVENLLTYSEDFSVWPRQSMATPVEVNVATAPDGTMTADRITFDANGGSQILREMIPSAGTYVLSVYAKTDSSPKRFRLSTYSATDNSQGSGVITTTGSWVRYSFVVTVTTSTYVYISNYGTPEAGTALFWGYQVENVTGQANQNPSEYVSTNVKTSAPYHGANVDGVKYFTTYNGNTVSSNVVTEATGADIPDATLHGYVAEGARTNLAKQSEDFSTTWLLYNGASVSANTDVSPRGDTTADSLIGATGVVYTSGAVVDQNISVSSNTQYTFSVYINLKTSTTAGVYIRDNTTGIITSTQALPISGWQRVVVVKTSGPSTTSFHCAIGNTNNTIAVWGAQLELGAFASSYIPTTTASVTRNADVLTYPTSGNANTTSGTFYTEALSNPNANQNNRGVLAINNSATNRIDARLNGTNWSSFFVTSNGVNQATSIGPVTQAGRTAKLALSWQTNRAIESTNGIVGTVDTSVAVPESFAVVRIGNIDSGSSQLYGTIRNVKIWKKALTDTQLTNMTSTNTSVAQSAVKKTLINVNQNDKLTSGLVGLWSFNGTDISGTTVYDRSGQGNNGTLTGGVTKTIGKVGQALSFDGVDDKITLSSALSIGTVHSFSAWIDFQDTVDGVIFGRNSGAPGYLLYIDQANVYYNANSGNFVTAPHGGMVAGQWSFITVVRNGTSVTFYKNGSVLGTTQTLVSDDTLSGVTTIGSYEDGTFYTKMKLDEVRIYNRALSANEVKQLYNMGR